MPAMSGVIVMAAAGILGTYISARRLFTSPRE
jgi:hypothetical protein